MMMMLFAYLHLSTTSLVDGSNCLDSAIIEICHFPIHSASVFDIVPRDRRIGIERTNG